MQMKWYLSLEVNISVSFYKPFHQNINYDF